MKNELSLPQRAAVALGTAEHEIRLIALVKDSERIVDVKDKAGRDECHTAYMVLKNTRIGITGMADNATEDAKAFTKAVKAEALRLLDITKAEESRLQELRDAFDAKVQAEKYAKIAAERARMDGIKADIQSIRNLALNAVGKPSIIIKAVIDSLDAIDETESRFAEFVPDAHLAINETLNTLIDLHNSTLDSEAEALRQQAEREAAAAQAQKEREELAAAQAELKRQQAAQAAETQRQRDALAAEMKADREKLEELRKQKEDADRLAKAESDRVAAEHAQKMVEQQAAMDARQRDLDHAEALQMNAMFDQLMESRRLLEEEIADQKAQQLAAARKLEEETVAVPLHVFMEENAIPFEPQKLQTIATELEWLQYFYEAADFGPADDDVRDIIKRDFVRRTGKQLPFGYNGEE
jgi:hypothetical protein